MLTIARTNDFHPVTGEPIYHYESTDKDGVLISDPRLTPAERADQSRFVPVVYTGPVKGTISIPGATYNVSDDYIEAPLEHHGLITHLIGVRHEQDQHPDHAKRGFRGNDGDPGSAYDPVRDEFRHVCTEACGELARTPDQFLAEFETRLVKLGYGGGSLRAALLGTTGENQALDSLTGGATNVMAYTNVNTASPGTTGANEMGTSTRQATSWNAASSGSKTQSTSLTYTTPGTTAATYFSTFSAVTAGTYGIGGALTSSVTAVTITVAAGGYSLSAS